MSFRPRPNCSIHHLPKLAGPVPTNESMAFYQLTQSMGGSPESLQTTKDMYSQMTGYEPPEYMSTCEARSETVPLSRLHVQLDPSYPWLKWEDVNEGRVMTYY